MGDVIALGVIGAFILGSLIFAAYKATQAYREANGSNNKTKKEEFKMDGVFNYLLKLIKFSGFCLVAMIFSQWFSININHSCANATLTIKHKSSSSEPIHIKHETSAFTRLHVEHSGYNTVRVN